MMLDRGQQKDWFSSLEVCIEAAASAFFLYLFVVHILTTRRPFIHLALLKDRNFLFGSLLGFFLGVLVFSVLRSEEHTSELQSLMRISYAVFCLKKKKHLRTT